MRIIRAVAAALVALAATTAPAQRGRGAAQYDRATVQAISGTVTHVDTVPSPRGLGGGMHVQVQSGTKTYDVHLGPKAWLAGKSLTLATGDQVQVTGSLITYGGGKALLAAAITRGATTVQLRDSTGVPLWARARGGTKP